MKKYILITLLIGLFGNNIAQDLTAVQSLPQEIQLSSSFVVETKINKGNLTGFVKFSQVLPAGFTAEDVDSKGGAFTFNEDGIRIIWTSPPTETEYSVSFKINVPAQSNGSLLATAKISYILGNERKIFDLPNHTFVIASGTSSASTPKAAERVVEVKKEEPVVKTEVVKAEEPVKAPEPVKTEVVKAEPVKVVPAEKVPTAAVPAVAGKIYKVQIGAFSAKPKIEGVTEISTLVLDNGITKYFSGNFSNYEDANKRKKMLIEKGFSGAFIVSFQDGKIVK